MLPNFCSKASRVCSDPMGATWARTSAEDVIRLPRTPRGGISRRTRSENTPEARPLAATSRTSASQSPDSPATRSAEASGGAASSRKAAWRPASARPPSGSPLWPGGYANKSPCRERPAPATLLGAVCSRIRNIRSLSSSMALAGAPSSSRYAATCPASTRAVCGRAFRSTLPPITRSEQRCQRLAAAPLLRRI